MRGGALPPALLCAALGFALAFAPRRALGASLAVLGLTAVAASLLPLGQAWIEPVFLGCWVGVALAAAAVHWRGGVPTTAALLLALNTGLWSGGVIAVAAEPVDLLKALPCALLCLPGQWIAARWPIVLKVAASWLIAVALLVAALPLTPTPGYAPDHMD